MNVIDAAYGVVHDYPGGSDSLAPRLGKASVTLSHEVARVGTAKLGLDTAVKVSVLTGDFRILDAFALQCGRMVLPLPCADGDHGGGGDGGCVMARLGELLGAWAARNEAGGRSAPGTAAGLRRAGAA